jgi:hypothetical protein
VHIITGLRTANGGWIPCQYVIANQPDPVRLTECREIIPNAKDKTLSISCPQAAAKQECLSNRAACGRCALDAVQRTSITVVGNPTSDMAMASSYTTWQDATTYLLVAGSNFCLVRCVLLPFGGGILFLTFVYP